MVAKRRAWKVVETHLSTGSKIGLGDPDFLEQLKLLSHSSVVFGGPVPPTNMF